jgi:thioester reductase-like protein
LLINICLDYPVSEIAQEERIEDPLIAAGAGYGESKWVTEQLLLNARSVNGVRATVVRVGQVSGDTRIGGWGTQEWLPNMIELSTRSQIAALPSRDGVCLTRSSTDWS